eukprot:gene21777-28796_t
MLSPMEPFPAKRTLNLEGGDLNMSVKRQCTTSAMPANAATVNSHRDVGTSYSTVPSSKQAGDSRQVPGSPDIIEVDGQKPHQPNFTSVPGSPDIIEVDGQKTHQPNFTSVRQEGSAMDIQTALFASAGPQHPARASSLPPGLTPLPGASSIAAFTKLPGREEDWDKMFRLLRLDGGCSHRSDPVYAATTSNRYKSAPSPSRAPISTPAPSHALGHDATQATLNRFFRPLPGAPSRQPSQMTKQGSPLLPGPSASYVADLSPIRGVQTMKEAECSMAEGSASISARQDIPGFPKTGGSPLGPGRMDGKQQQTTAHSSERQDVPGFSKTGRAPLGPGRMDGKQQQEPVHSSERQDVPGFPKTGRAPLGPGRMDGKQQQAAAAHSSGRQDIPNVTGRVDGMQQETIGWEAPRNRTCLPGRVDGRDQGCVDGEHLEAAAHTASLDGRKQHGAHSASVSHPMTSAQVWAGIQPADTQLPGAHSARESHPTASAQAWAGTQPGSAPSGDKQQVAHGASVSRPTSSAMVWAGESSGRTPPHDQRQQVAHGVSLSHPASSAMAWAGKATASSPYRKQQQAAPGLHTQGADVDIDLAGAGGSGAAPGAPPGGGCAPPGGGGAGPGARQATKRGVAATAALGGVAEGCNAAARGLAPSSAGPGTGPRQGPKACVDRGVGQAGGAGKSLGLSEGSMGPSQGARGPSQVARGASQAPGM